MANTFLQDLPAILAQVGALGSGNDTFARTWQALEAQKQRRMQDEEDLRLRKEDRAFRKRQYEDEQKTTANKTLAEFLGLAGKQLGDPEIDDPAIYQQRMTTLSALAPRVGANSSELATMFPAPAPTVMQQRQAKKKLEQISKSYRPEQLQQLETSGVFEVAGERLTLAQLRDRALGGGALTAEGQPMTLPPVAKPNVAEPGSFEEYVSLPPDQQVARRRQRKEYMQADDKGPDPILSELRQIRLDQARAGQAAGPTLPPATQRRVDAKARSFESLPIVKTTQKQAEAVSFGDSLDPNTKNPADDQALIYAFAKAMDPDSVVREGEYATVQKYAQSWAESFGFNAARVFSNTQFLTPQSRQNMKATIRKRYQAGKSQYDNVRKSYVNQINKITGQGDGDSYLTDYGAGFPQDASPATTTQPAGQKMKVGRFDVEVR